MMISGFIGFLTEEFFWFNCATCVVISLYLYIRILAGIAACCYTFCVVVYKISTLVTYLFATVAISVVGYCFIKMKRQLMLEGYKIKARSQKWKRVLDITQDAIVVCDGERVLYHNLALEALFDRTGFLDTTPDIGAEINSIFSGTEFVDTYNRAVPWSGGTRLRQLTP
ncbi:MAG: hypothetical protein P4M11_10085 [Candidatus Pacebacteria bacterium]|nr:hypothetical protein [Candidatus Paceibacterota bacterium]